MFQDLFIYAKDLFVAAMVTGCGSAPQDGSPDIFAGFFIK
jgi:hypothetical protein